MIDQLKFDANGLIPAVVQDYFTKKVLTVAYMNRESLEISMKEGRTCFFSRSRQQLWRKGETSGNTQEIVNITADCDGDALVVAAVRDLVEAAAVFGAHHETHLAGDLAYPGDFVRLALLGGRQDYLAQRATLGLEHLHDGVASVDPLAARAEFARPPMLVVASHL